MRRLLVLACIAAGVAASGAGAASAAVPGAPTNVVAALGNTRATVKWAAPASDGGSPISEYIVTASGGSNQTCTAPAGSLECTVHRLVNGTSYTFTVAAYNTNGGGPASAPSNAVTPAGQPAPPTNVTATPGNKEAIVDCTAPATNGGAPITSYTATSSPGSKHGTATSCPITVKGLVNGTSYTFTVTATNGTKSAASTPSAAVTPADTRPPTRPARVTGRFEHGSLVLTWSPSKAALGVAGYEVSLNGKPLLKVTGATTATLHAFARHGTSVYTVIAFDTAGTQGPASPSVRVRPTPMPKGVPRTVPGWTSKLLAWQQHGDKGARPKTPKPLPKWYAAWKHWRSTPFEVVS